MKQPRKIDKASTVCKPPTPKKNKQIKQKGKRWHPQYGTSKLEEDFAKNFLDKLGVEYTYQFEARDIGRFYDFAVLGKKDCENIHNGGKPLLIEIDGDYFHTNPEIQKDKPMNKMQQKNKRVDEYKDKWAHLHGYPIMRIWENDIRKKPKEVMERLRERLYIQEGEIRKKGRNLGKQG